MLKEIIDTSKFTLDEFKIFRYEEIDARTEELIALGYTYDSVQFSLSQNAQINLIGLDNIRDELTYPITYNNIDDTATYSIADATTIHNMYLQALGVKKAHLDSGTALKDQIRAAVDRSAVEAIVDNR